MKEPCSRGRKHAWVAWSAVMMGQHLQSEEWTSSQVQVEATRGCRQERSLFLCHEMFQLL